MEIVPDNDQIVYTNSSGDPYSNGNASFMLGQNQTTCDNIIGSANYDIGHVFGTNSGGIASLGSVCSNSSKARGVTGGPAPVGDPFDIDYVAHEMGHQFGANHTQNNNCNRNNFTATEPGSASTIMGYAGICSPNVQNYSDDHFHGTSKNEIGSFITGSTHTCAVVSSVGNAGPVISSTSGNITIPANTPFALSAVATDADGDILTYCWEQINNQISSQPPLATSTAGPNFRSFSPSLSPVHYFPRLSTIASNGPFTWERLPSVSRTMNFRVSVHDNHPVAACNDFADVSVTVDGNSGPFVVSYPSASAISWARGSQQTIAWNVANTNNAPVNCASVDILFSDDGGLSFPVILAAGVPNDGAHEITVPSAPTSSAKIMVISSAGTFFDISDNNFNIISNGFVLSSAAQTLSACSPDNVAYTIDIDSIGGFADPVSLSISGIPTGLSHTFSPATVTPPGSSVLTISSTSSLGTGNYNFSVQGVSGSLNLSYPLYLSLTNIDTSVTFNSGKLIASQSGASYQWIDCNNGNQPITGANDQTFTPMALTGSYAVIIGLNSCNRTSNCNEVDLTGIGATSKNLLQLFPNPSKEILHISGINPGTRAIKITDLQGRMLKTITVSEDKTLSIDLSSFPSGMYFVHIESNNGYGHYKIIRE
jgi:hypothetical protein